MNALIAQFSGLFGVLIFMAQLWSQAPLDRALSMAAVTGLVLYLILAMGHLLVLQILEYKPPKLAEDLAGGQSNPSSPEEKSEATQSEEPAPTP